MNNGNVLLQLDMELPDGIDYDELRAYGSRIIVTPEQMVAVLATLDATQLPNTTTRAWLAILTRRLLSDLRHSQHGR